ncbi:hypothetical protein NARC_30178 [Candidatus Nitrosocosmicus arcticus]|uniref:Uncharacterized protein n=1 Tax=Candidatus Nitrosocosmicus arcticus TaxID=2035267 RepID=A0A557SXZ9_9ARCH|nr:hypothetical protein NARC_30178 [Candidatus Nitrosocosmicus arcticus]
MEIISIICPFIIFAKKSSLVSEASQVLRSNIQIECIMVTISLPINTCHELDSESTNH